jgi:hypothetical protein
MSATHNTNSTASCGPVFYQALAARGEGLLAHRTPAQQNR